MPYKEAFGIFWQSSQCCYWIKLIKLSQFSKNIFFIFSRIIIALSSIDGDFLPCFMFRFMWNVRILIISLVALRVSSATHFSCCWNSSSGVVSIIWHNSLWFEKGWSTYIIRSPEAIFTYRFDIWDNLERADRHVRHPYLGILII